MNLGSRIREERELLSLSQSELASRLGMQATQLCKIELGRTKPSMRTLERLAAALDVTVADLFARGRLPARSVESLAGERDFSCCHESESEYQVDPNHLIPLRRSDTEPALSKENMAAVYRRERELSALEDELKLPSATMLPLSHPFVGDERGAEVLARAMRSILDVGSSALSDLSGLLEYRNVRQHFLELPHSILSRSFFDVKRRTLSIVVNSCDTHERQTYRLAYELGWACLFGSWGFKTLEDSTKSHRFARRFAAAFLMPEESVRAIVAQTGLTPQAWTMTSLCRIKARFHVSAEAFALRLESLGLISPTIRATLRDELRCYYVTHPQAMEPQPSPETQSRFDVLKASLGAMRRAAAQKNGKIRGGYDQ
ncbi:MAG: ImmA/IrrE family metallo-endopeptidase [Kiritimatiellae bacterium]|nr:ImmA/IrrE family metallo-endopeptidase [Kiritimatiellia bacterium]